MTRIKVALIGCGRMGARRAGAIAGNSQAELAYVVDEDLPRAKSLSEKFGCPALSDFQSLPGPGDFDAAVISTPNSSHYQIASKFLEAGQHVFCEKPLATSSRDAEKLVELADSHQAVLQVGANARRFGNVVKAKEIISAGQLGKLLFARGWIGHDGWVLRDEPWANQAELMGGGTLFDNGHHLIDLVRWLVGEVHPVAGYGIAGYHKLDAEREDNFVATLHGPAGEPIMLQSSWTDWQGYLYLEVYGSKGSLTIDCREGRSMAELRPREESLRSFDFSSEGPVSFRREIDEFVDAVSARHSVSPDGRDGLRIIRIIEDLYLKSRLQAP